jgi:regulator of sigma E protease
VTLTPTAEREDVGSAAGTLVGRVGVGPDVPVVHRRFGPLPALAYGAEATWSTVAMIGTSLGRLVSGRESPRGVGSLLTIGKVSGDAARQGMERFFEFMALFSINLAVLNLLPIPILDGGHLMFLGLEALRGRPLSVEQRIRLSHVGLILIVGIMLWGMTNDVLLHVLGI